ncbi:hypothetical protein P5673_025101, partial [Acropora cervicornis]
MAGKPAPKKERAWTETELKYLALVLADEKNQFAVRLETLALKKSANNDVFEDRFSSPLTPFDVWSLYPTSMSYVNDTHPLNGKVHNLTPGQSLTIQLAQENVPEQAYPVVIYAIFANGIYKPGAAEPYGSFYDGGFESLLFCLVVLGPLITTS